MAGTVSCWGWNVAGQVGDRSNANRLTAFAIPGLPPTVSLAAGSYHTCALDAGSGQLLWKRALGGWSVAGISSFQSGAPFTVGNGFDRNNDGIQNDRPDIGNPLAPYHCSTVLRPQPTKVSELPP